MHRERHEGVVLVREQDVLKRYPLWDPRAPGRVWDFDDPPYVDGIEELTMDYAYRVCSLPTETMLAQFGSDAVQLIEGLLVSEREHTAHLSVGMERSQEALAKLAV